MKNGKTLLIIAAIIVILLLLAWVISMSNKKKTAAAAANQTAPNANILGRHIVASTGTDYSETVNGKAKWLWSGRGNCSSDYTKILSGVNSGWCLLTTELNRSVPPSRSLGAGKKWCCAQIKSNGDCETWEQRDSGSPCETNA